MGIPTIPPASTTGGGLLTPLELPVSAGTWAEPIQKTGIAAVPMTLKESQAAGTAMTGKAPDLPSLPPSMAAFHQRPDAVKGPPPPPGSPIKHPITPPKSPAPPQPLPTTSPPPQTPAPTTKPPINGGVPVPPIVVQSKAEAPPPSSSSSSSSDDGESTSASSSTHPPTKWAFGQGTEYNYVPSGSRKPDDQVDPYGYKENADYRNKGKAKPKPAAGSGANKKPSAPSGSSAATPDSNKAVADIFSNVMGRLKF
ncbi:Uncharacterized protein PBTT_00422 [Plasmodiophora brassicae]